MLVCTNCWEDYESITGNIMCGSPCPKRECSGEVADIDELLLPSIILLNEKGYFAEFCCSGHFHAGTSDSSYISFCETVEQADIALLPKGFTFDPHSQNCVCIRREFTATDQFDIHRKAAEAAIDVLEWAQALPAMADM